MDFISVIADLGLVVFFIILLCVILFYFDNKGDI